jgi:hypothetical protein
MNKSVNQLGGGNCSICGSPGVTKATCPLNPQAAKPAPAKHPLASTGKPVAPVATKTKALKVVKPKAVKTQRARAAKPKAAQPVKKDQTQQGCQSEQTQQVSQSKQTRQVIQVPQTPQHRQESEDEKLAKKVDELLLVLRSVDTTSTLPTTPPFPLVSAKFTAADRQAWHNLRHKMRQAAINDNLQYFFMPSIFISYLPALTPAEQDLYIKLMRKLAQHYGPNAIANANTNALDITQILTHDILIDSIVDLKNSSSPKDRLLLQQREKLLNPYAECMYDLLVCIHAINLDDEPYTIGTPDYIREEITKQFANACYSISEKRTFLQQPPNPWPVCAPSGEYVKKSLSNTRHNIFSTLEEGNKQLLDIVGKYPAIENIDEFANITIFNKTTLKEMSLHIGRDARLYILINRKGWKPSNAGLNANQLKIKDTVSKKLLSYIAGNEELSFIFKKPDMSYRDVFKIIETMNILESFQSITPAEQSLLTHIKKVLDKYKFFLCLRYAAYYKVITSL